MLEGVYAITPDWTDTSKLLAVTESILSGGCRLLQYRQKNADTATRRHRAEALRDLTRRHAAWLIINDDVELALAVEADGAHLGQEDGDLRLARARLGPGYLLGASCYQSLNLAQTAVDAGADYIAFGSFFPSPTKPRAGRANPALLTAARPLGVPVAAIGGITLDNAPPLLAAGAQMLAVISALYEAPDPAAAVRDFLALNSQAQA